MFSWIIPVIIVANVPSRLLLHSAEAPLALMLHLLAASLFVVIAGRVFWRYALGHYASASS